MSVELPKDAEGREIPLDTEILYDENGNEYEVYYYKYSVRQTIPQRKWQVVMMDCIVHDVSDLYITPPDSWEKLEEDLDRASKKDDAFYTRVCAYMNQSGDTCNDCRLLGSCISNCTDKMLKDVVSRIRKLRGEGDA